MRQSSATASGKTSDASTVQKPNGPAAAVRHGGFGSACQPGSHSGDTAGAVKNVLPRTARLRTSSFSEDRSGVSASDGSDTTQVPPHATHCKLALRSSLALDCLICSYLLSASHVAHLPGGMITLWEARIIPLYSCSFPVLDDRAPINTAYYCSARFNLPFRLPVQSALYGVICWCAGAGGDNAPP